MSAQAAYRGYREDTNGKDDNLWSRRPSLVERQQFNDHLMMGEMFTDWHAFDHPTFGEIEIGGWREFSVRTSPGWMLPEMLHRNAMFVIWTAGQMPQVDLEITEVKNMGGDVFRVRARAINEGAIPTLSSRAREKRLVPEDLFTIEGEQLTVLSGGVLRDEFFDEVEPNEHRPWRIATYIRAFKTREVQWFVQGNGDFSVGYEGVKCGKTSISGQLK